ncbi:unnamed protein product, partial [marine sediment metagenome]
MKGTAIISRLNVKILIALLLALSAGYIIRGLTHQSPAVQLNDDGTEHAQPAAQWWTCSMHPQIRQPKP